MLLKFGMNLNSSFMFSDLLFIKDQFCGDKQSDWHCFNYLPAWIVSRVL